MRIKTRTWTVGLLAAALSISIAGLGGAAAVAGVGDEVSDGTFPFTAKITIGDQAVCSGALVAPAWVITAKSCFPGGVASASGGLPGGLVTSVTVGRADLTGTSGHRLMATQVVANPDRDVALVKLSAAVKDIAPVKLSTVASDGDSLRIAGYGRTADTWFPTRLHAGSYTVASVTATGIAVQGIGGATLCKGDAGGPALRVDGADAELVGVSSISWQKGCLGEPETRDGASEVRVDDLASWIDSATAVVPTGGLLPSGVTRMATGEFTGDDNSDLIGVDAANNPWLFPGRASHTFGDPIRVGAGWSGYRELAVGRMNRDAYNDLVVADTSNNLWYLPGNGHGGWAGTRVSLGTTFTSDFRDFVVGHFNNDSYDDVLAVQTSTGKLIMWPGLAAGGIGSHIETGWSGTGWGCCKAITKGDFNGDGLNDLIAADSSGKLREWTGNANGTINGSQLIDTGVIWNSAADLAAYKLDGTGKDGLLEIVGPPPAGQSSTGDVFFTATARTAAGGWTPYQLPGTSFVVQPSDMAKVVSGEFTGDSNPDLIGQDAAGGGWLFPGLPSRTFDRPIKVGAGWTGYREMTVGRMNRDGHDDLVVADTSNNLWYYPGNGDGGWAGARVSLGTTFTSDFRDFVVGHFNNDSYDDVLAVQTSTGKLIMWPGLAAGGIGSHIETGWSGTGWGCCKEIAKVDYNGDGVNDLIATDVGTGKLREWNGTAAGPITGSALLDAPGTVWGNRISLTGLRWTGTGTTGLAYLQADGLVLDPPNAAGGIDWNDPIAYGPRA